jgi:hypothetical protein
MNNLINLISDIKNINQFGSSYSNLDSNRVIVNLMWINNEISIINKYVFNETHKDNCVIPYINAWLDKNIKVYFWIDYNTVTESQVTETTEYFKSNPLFEIKFINTLIYGKYDDIIPCQLYLKVDFYRLVVLDYLLNNEEYSMYTHFIYSDILVKALEISDIVNNQILNTYQLILSGKNKGDRHGDPYENSFIGVTNNDEIKLSLNNFINIAYKIVLVNKSYFRPGEITDCKYFNSDSNQIFYTILKALIVIQIKSIFYREILNELQIINLIKDGLLGDEKIILNVTTSILNPILVLPYEIMLIPFGASIKVNKDYINTFIDLTVNVKCKNLLNKIILERNNFISIGEIIKPENAQFISKELNDHLSDLYHKTIVERNYNKTSYYAIPIIDIIRFNPCLKY